ncbi:class I SAM-dependent methyltransferase [Pedobacter aquatilis]|uniref:class I SAM-dependent methyltransferase n=1 Tax=Pedobacter aquatilis TaxID=351343 RepID=UPI00292E8A07|nr:class I SAM-dependent methyltransferase [Pedobacter aquatilis]
MLNSDQAFNACCTPEMQAVSNIHWSPVHIARIAAGLLARPGAKVLDVGCGIGKFCLVGASIHPHTIFHGIDVREKLISEAEDLKQLSGLQNVSFTHGDMNDCSFSDFSAIYFFNAFYENLVPKARIDSSPGFGLKRYAHDFQVLRNKLALVHPGTRLVTYCSVAAQVPKSFRLITRHKLPTELNFYVKVD